MSLPIIFFAKRLITDGTEELSTLHIDVRVHVFLYIMLVLKRHVADGTSIRLLTGVHLHVFPHSRFCALRLVTDRTRKPLLIRVHLNVSLNISQLLEILLCSHVVMTDRTMDL